jgi:hypothetical protein
MPGKADFPFDVPNDWNDMLVGTTASSVAPAWLVFACINVKVTHGRPIRAIPANPMARVSLDFSAI